MGKEIELKLAVPDAALAELKRHPLIAGAQQVGRAQILDNTYFDTPALDLLKRRIAVRIRRQGRHLLQTVKCAATSVGGLSSRQEWEQPYAGESFDFSAIEQSEVREFLERERDNLVPVFSTVFRRETYLLTPAPDIRVLAMLDTGSVEADGRKLPISELELELEQGGAHDLFALAVQFAASLPLVPEDASKAQRGYRLFTKQAPAPARAGTSPVQPGQSPLEAFRAIAGDCLRQWQANFNCVQDSDDPEFVHQLRVALRRLRAAVRLFSELLPKDFVARWSPVLRNAAGDLGRTRDLDVMLSSILAPVIASGISDSSVEKVLTLATTKRDEEKSATHARLLAAGHGRLMLEFAAELHALSAPAGDANLATFARKALARERKQARKLLAKAIDTLKPDALHALRIALKRLRYSLEFLAPLLPPRATQRYRTELAVLGGGE
ncbi:MAG: CHAD domain-containing protein [Zoogloea sp.]|nr:CHAD domain-containing protein [Zoogloea sp.]